MESHTCWTRHALRWVIRKRHCKRRKTVLPAGRRRARDCPTARHALCLALRKAWTPNVQVSTAVLNMAPTYSDARPPVLAKGRFWPKGAVLLRLSSTQGGKAAATPQGLSKATSLRYWFLFQHPSYCCQIHLPSPPHQLSWRNLWRRKPVADSHTQTPLGMAGMSLRL